MKTYKEAEEKQKECEKKFIELRNQPNPDKKLVATYSQWVDILGELRINNVVEYAKKIGYDFNSNEEIFEFTEEAKKEMFITEEQARNDLEAYKINYKHNPNRTSNYFGGINMDKINIEILEWLLE